MPALAERTMDAMVLEADRSVLRRRLPIPRPGPDEVLVAVMATGICGSDLAVYRGTHPYKVAPGVLGHELSGTVVEVGPGVTRLRPGDRVCAASFSPCERCRMCISGEIQLCEAKATLNHEGWDGSFAEFVVLRENMAFVLPASVDWAAGALVEPLSVGLHAVRIAARRGARNLVILGTGNIGLCCLVAAVRLGIRTVCVDVREQPGAVARGLGADAFVNAAPGDGVARARRALPGGGADAVVVACDYPEVFDDAAALARRGGAVVAVSYFHRAAGLPLNALVGGELALLGSALCGGQDIEDVIDWLAAGLVDPLPMVSHRLALEELDAGMRMMDSGRSRAGKILIEVGARSGAGR
ncbi:MAG TPA: alcohol dehydrogenase catalytic domain-containing protein [Solirubrobacterales bacterium]|nr:alcohol dehydrogenase catalytic domain-containing protein [Solirubrobacterales bacterium]